MSFKLNHSIIVQKYGGVSVANVKRIKNVARIISKFYKKSKKIVVVVSAMGSTTDNLINLAKKINSQPSKREIDMLISTGEQIASSLLAMALHRKGLEAISFMGSQAGIITDTLHTQAKIIKIDTARIKKELNRGRIVIIAGFQGVSIHNEITTLGRGGSDLSAVALAAALGANSCEIYTDVEGIYTADPHIVPEARKITYLTFDEMLELALRGAQVMQLRAIEVAKKFNISLNVKSSFSEKEGTIIMEKTPFIEESAVRSITFTENEVKITVCDVPDKPGIAADIFNRLSLEGINIDMIVQNVSHKNITDISFTIDVSNLNKMLKDSDNISNETGIGEVLIDKNIAKISIIGVGMRSRYGIAAKCFYALAKNKINIEMISTSDISISCIVKKKDRKSVCRERV